MKLLADLKVSAQSSFCFQVKRFIDPEQVRRRELEADHPAANIGHKIQRSPALLASQLIANGETAAYVHDQMGHRASRSPSILRAFVPRPGREASSRYEKAMEQARGNRSGC